MYYDHKKVEWLKERYPEGTRICLDRMNDDPFPVESGTLGRVDHVDDIGWFCQYHLTHFIRTRIMQRERYDHSRAFFELPEAAHRWRCRFFCWPSNSYNISRS